MSTNHIPLLTFVSYSGKFSVQISHRLYELSIASLIILRLNRFDDALKYFVLTRQHRLVIRHAYDDALKLKSKTKINNVLRKKKKNQQPPNTRL